MVDLLLSGVRESSSGRSESGDGLIAFNELERSEVSFGGKDKWRESTRSSDMMTRACPSHVDPLWSPPKWVITRAKEPEPDCVRILASEVRHQRPIGGKPVLDLTCHGGEVDLVIVILGTELQAGHLFQIPLNVLGLEFP